MIACASLCTVAGYSQQTDPNTNDAPVKLEKYVVTGSNIPRTEVAGEAQTFPVLTSIAPPSRRAASSTPRNCCRR